MFKKSLWQGIAYVSSFVLSLALVGGSIMESYTSYVDDFFNTKSTKAVAAEGETIYESFTPDEKYLTSDGKGDSKKIIEEAVRLGAQIGEEGTVLLKNDNDTLPLASSSKVTMLGLRSEVPLLGAGMGVLAKGSMINFYDALEGTKTKFDQEDHIATYYNRSAYGGGKGLTIDASAASTFDNYDIESAGFKVNPTMAAVYKSYNESLGENGLTNNDSIPNPATTPYSTSEPSLAQLESINSSYKASFTDYGDAAIVVVGRPSNESYDYWKGNAKDDDGSAMEPLQLSKNEKAAIELATQNFDKVVVLINSASPMDIQELEDNDKIGAIAYIGQPGLYGLLGVGRVLSGKASPSGKLVDTFASNQLSAPAMMNFGDYTYANASSMTRKTTIGGENTSRKYVVEAEGLYTGYKYYETRYADTVTGEGSNAKGTAGVTAVGATEWDYDKEVTYAFGYGLSYTKFTQELKGDPVVTHEGNTYTLDFTVTVTNEGTKAGKDVVEIYGQAPYTNGGLEKSAIQLLGFGKTKELAAGAHEDVTVHVDLQNLATYDMNHANSDSTKGGYVLEKGDYYFALGNGAHEALNNVLAKRGYSTVVGESKKVYMQTLTTDDYTTFAKSKSGAEVHNQLDYSDWNYYDDSNAVTYLSRSDWQTTYPKEYKDLTAPQKLIDDLNGTGENYYQYNANSTGADVTWGKEGDANLADMFQADWNDKRWDDLLDQVTLEEAVLMIMYGGPNLAGATSVGWSTGLYLTENSGSGIVITLGGTKDSDAPWAISSKDNNAGWSGGVFANAPTTAASYNPDLWHELGEFIGTESLFTGIPFLWGPGLNTHRASYNGRTGEYYSEDGVLAGNVAMEYAMGAMNYGLITAPKHFAFNDQETNRAGVSPFMTEQRARETELRAYQIAVEADKYDRLTNKDVGMRGLMTSFSKIGGVEVTCSYGLMTEILQNEWGFHGYAVTDIYDDTDMFVPVAASGVTCYDLRGMQPSMGVSLSSFANQSQGYTHAVETYAKDKTLQARMKLAVKNLLWVTAQSNMMNYISMNRQWRMTSWRATYIFVSIAAGVIAAGSVAMYVLTDLNVFKKKEEN